MPDRRASLALAALALLAAGGGGRAQDGPQPAWRDLFDGASLDGWIRRGGTATFAVEDGAIIGTTAPGSPNTFLCTEQRFSDFELELEVQVDGELNSGIQVRSAARPDGRVFGYQVEVDPSDRAWSGGIYDEGRRGWLWPLAEDSPARAAFRRGGWNRYRIVCLGDWLRTWVNGVPAADLRDPVDMTGFVALQVHGVGQRADPLCVRWRNLRLRDLGSHRWVPILDGTSLDGWRALPGGAWQIEDGVLVGTHAAGEPRHGVLLSERRYGDFTARLRYRAVRGNSGFYFRCEPVDSAVAVHGLQAEIDAAENAGMLYETGGRARIAVPDPELVERAFEPGAWNDMVVSAHGGRITIHLNGHRMAELRDDPGRAEGHLGLQLHGDQDVRIEIARIELLQ